MEKEGIIIHWLNSSDIKRIKLLIENAGFRSN
jgi:hypothetical protein